VSIQLSSLAEQPRGEFQLRVYRGGDLVEEWVEKNLIVDGSKFALAHLLGGDVTGNSVKQIAFGTSGTAPASGNTSITNSYPKLIDSVTYPASNQVSFNFSLGTGEANGKAIMEFGLLTEVGTLFARKVRVSALNKESDISLSGSWIISF
jgi:hypothetical protein